MASRFAVILLLGLMPLSMASRAKFDQYAEFLRSVPRESVMGKMLEKEMNLESAQKGLGETGFTCPEPNSPEVPTSVHALRPGDIKVVAAMGDSYSAANGAESSSVFDVTTEYRGKSFSMGGDDDITEHVTIANILRSFTPDLKGFSVRDGTEEEFEVSQFNRAVAGEEVDDMLDQANDLVQKMREHPELVNIEEDWKLVTLFIGGNDLCDSCNRGSTTGADYIRLLREAIQVLKDNLPRTLVSVVGMARFDMLVQVAGSRFGCRFAVGTFCDCAFDSSLEEHAQNSIEFQEAMAALENGEFDADDDFTVVIQPFLEDTSEPPQNDRGNIDLSLFAPDCFHLSTKGHEIAARGLWNNMLQPVGAKARDFDLSPAELQCPAEDCPFFRTTKNSVNCGV